MIKKGYGIYMADRLKEIDKKINKRYSDLNVVYNKGLLVICGGGYLELWSIAIDQNFLHLRRNYQIDDDLLILANEIRKEYFNVI